MIENQLLASIIKIMVIFLVALIALGLMLIFIVIPMLIKGDETEVPYVGGMSLSESMSKLQEKDLSAEINPQRKASSKVKEGHVLEQEPRPGFKVKPNRKIYLTLSAGSENIIVPDLTGKLLREVQLVLKSEGFRLGNIARVHSDDFPAVDTIIAQTPLSRSVTPRGTQIALLLSSGVRPKMLLMPDLREKKLDDIRNTIEKSGLKIRNIKPVLSREYGEGTILSHKPQANQIIKVGQYIDFEVSGSDIREQGRPVVIEHTVTLSGIERKHVKIIINDESRKGRRTIVDGMFEPGFLIRRFPSVVGKSVMIVYEDDMENPIITKQL